MLNQLNFNQQNITVMDSLLVFNKTKTSVYLIRTVMLFCNQQNKDVSVLD